MTRLQRAIAAAVVLLPLWLIHAAAGPNPADEQKVTACLEASYDKNTSGLECIGIIADPCIAAASQTDSYLEDNKACASRELAIWSGRVAKGVAGIQRHGKSAVASVTAAQKSFADSLSKLCPLYDRVDPGMAPGGGAYCRLQETAMRALSLDRLSRAMSPH